MDNIILQQMLEIPKVIMKRGEFDKMSLFFTNEKVIKYLQSLMSDSAHRNFVVSATLSNCMLTSLEMGLDSQTVLSFSNNYIKEIDSISTNDEAIRLISQICTNFSQLANSYIQTSLGSLVNKVEKYISSHLSEKVIILDMAKELGISESTLHTNYKKETGKTIHQTILDHKLAYGRFLLEYSNIDISDISYQLSFSSQSHFTYQFKKYYGITPKQLRLSSK